MVDEVRNRHQFFIYWHSIILSTVIKYDPYFTQLAWMIYAMMRNKPSFALLHLLEWFFSIHFLNHIFHEPYIIFMVLFVSAKPFLKVFMSCFSHASVVWEQVCNVFSLYCILFPSMSWNFHCKVLCCYIFRGHVLNWYSVTWYCCTRTCFTNRTNYVSSQKSYKGIWITAFAGNDFQCFQCLEQLLPIRRPMEMFKNIRHNCAFQKLWTISVCLNFRHWNIHTEGNYGYRSICCITISKFSFREKLC